MLWVWISIRARCTTLCDKVCQWLATGSWFSPGPPVSSINKTDRHDITEILLKVALNTTKQTNTFHQSFWDSWSKYYITAKSTPLLSQYIMFSQKCHMQLIPPNFIVITNFLTQIRDTCGRYPNLIANEDCISFLLFDDAWLSGKELDMIILQTTVIRSYTRHTKTIRYKQTITSIWSGYW
jgi:hypothetical protein